MGKDEMLLRELALETIEALLDTNPRLAAVEPRCSAVGGDDPRLEVELDGATYVVDVSVRRVGAPTRWVDRLM